MLPCNGKHQGGVLQKLVLEVLCSSVSHDMMHGPFSPHPSPTQSSDIMTMVAKTFDYVHVAILFPTNFPWLLFASQMGNQPVSRGQIGNEWILGDLFHPVYSIMQVW